MRVLMGDMQFSLTEKMNFQLCFFPAVGTHLVKQKMTKNIPRFKGDSLPGTVVEQVVDWRSRIETCRDTEPTAENDFADFVPVFDGGVTSLLGL
jgi:hypothetical protein